MFICGDCTKILCGFPNNYFDFIFADPPYNLSLIDKEDLDRGDGTKYRTVKNEWDNFISLKEFTEFSRQWLTQCKRILKPKGTIMVSGSYHNIFTIGHLMLQLRYWILNDIIWVKPVGTPNFKGTRFKNAHEIIIWAKKQEIGKYTFNYRLMKKLNGNVQMKAEWTSIFPPNKREMLYNKGERVNYAQKPEALLERIVLAVTNEGDLILDPFCGTGTTLKVADYLGRRAIGIDSDMTTLHFAQQRLSFIKNKAF